MNVKEITFRATRNNVSENIRINVEEIYTDVTLKALTDEFGGYFLPFSFNGDEYDGELYRRDDGTLGLNCFKVLQGTFGRYRQDWWNNDNRLIISDITIKYSKAE